MTHISNLIVKGRPEPGKISLSNQGFPTYSKTVRHILFFKEGRMTSSLAVYDRNHPYFRVFGGG